MQPEPEDSHCHEASGDWGASSSWQDCPQSMVCCLLRVVLIHAVCTLIVRMRIPVPGPRMRPKTANGTRPGLSRVLLSLWLVVLNVLQPEPEDRRHPEASGGSRASSSWQDCPQSMVCCLLRVVLIHALCTVIVRIRIPMPGTSRTPKTANARPGLSRTAKTTKR